MNPHGWLYIDVTNPDGTVTNWAIRGGRGNSIAATGPAQDRLSGGNRGDRQRLSRAERGTGGQRAERHHARREKFLPRDGSGRTPEPMIELRQVSRHFQVGEQTVHALDQVDLAIESGEFISIMGPSGSGKSTLLNILGLLDRPTLGSYRLNGTDVAKLDDSRLADQRQKNIGFVFQSFHLIPRLNALENVELPMVLAGEPMASRRERARQVLQSMGLGERLDHRPDQLSGGERQRVAIGRAIVMNPKVLLADEPTGNLDSQASSEVIDILHRLNRDGLSLLVVTHDPEIGGQARRRLAMRDGRIIPGSQRRLVMKPVDTTRLAMQSILRYPLRTSMLLLAVAIGVTAVVLLTSVGEGARRYVTGEFASLGTNLLVVFPGKSDTTGRRRGHDDRRNPARPDG